MYTDYKPSQYKPEIIVRPHEVKSFAHAHRNNSNVSCICRCAFIEQARRPPPPSLQCCRRPESNIEGVGHFAIHRKSLVHIDWGGRL